MTRTFSTANRSPVPPVTGDDSSLSTAGSPAGRSLSGLLILTGFILVAFGLRVYHLGSPPLLWDEGWSIGLSRLSLAEIARITALDVHPPLYYLLLKGWLAFGPHQFVTRFLSVVAGVLSVPLAYHAGRAWRGERVGRLTAFYVTVAPPLIYYSQITRMFALCVTFLVLGTYGLLRMLDAAASRPAIGFLAFVVGAAGALYSFYYAGFVVAALFVYALIAAPRRLKATLAGFGGVAVLYLPWVLRAAPAMLNRVGERTGFTFALGEAARLAVDGFYGLVFPYGIGWPAVIAVVLVIAAGAGWGRRRLGRWALLPLLAIGVTLFGAALGAQAHMFAARYTIVASPFVALAVAGSLGLLVADGENGGWKMEDGRWTPFSIFHFPSSILLAVGLVLILATTVPTIANYVYAKSYEVFDPFDPSADWQVLREPADADDVVFFNVLSLAGTYQRYRTPDDPPWSYALRWDPVIEPLATAQARIEAAAKSHDRLWFVLYKGTVAANAALKAWLDERFYPAEGLGWHEDTLYLSYVDPRGLWQDVALDARFGNIVLEGARYTPAGSQPGCATCAAAGVDLVWRADGPIQREAKVFVHLYDPAGSLVAQHDSVPVNGTRPTPTWQAGETLVDRHGLALPEGIGGPLQLIVGLYAPATGERLRTADGRETVEIGMVTHELDPG